MSEEKQSDRVDFIRKDNKLQDFLEHLNGHMDIFTNIKGLVGITLNGGLARGYGDHLSEIDLTIFLDDDAYEKWEQGESEICTGICIYDKVVYDIKYVNYGDELKRKLSPIVELWDLSYAKILHDPSGKIEALHVEKLSASYDVEIICPLMFEVWWYYKLTGDIWIYREDPLQGHMLLNEAAKGLLKAIFIANKAYVPHDKWLAHYGGKLNWTPSHWREMKRKILSSRNMSMESLVERQAAIHSVWSEVNNYVREEYFHGEPSDVSTKHFYDLIRLMQEKKKIPIEEWLKVSTLKALNEDPLHKFVVKKGDWILFNEDAFRSLSPDSMYYWHYKAVSELG